MTTRAREWYWHGGHLWPFETNDRAEFEYTVRQVELEKVAGDNHLELSRQHLEEVRSVLHY